MKLTKYALISAFVLAGALAVPATAQETTPPAKPGTKTPGVNQRQQNQKGRIQQGVRSGELTRDETQALVQEEKAIQAEKKEYKSDGTVTKDERKDLHQDLNEASKDIYTQKHDDDRRDQTPRVDQREQNQRERIQQGVRSGELTKPEARRLRTEQKDIRRDERAAKSDGRVTAGERKQLHREQNTASRDIHRQKHDAQKRPRNK